VNAARAWRGLAAAAVLALSLAGCSTVLSPMSDAASHVPPAKPVQVDPWERFNRAVFSFNDSVDRAVLIPLARAYKKVVPEIVSQGFENVVNNVTDVWSAVNHLLQGKPQQALDTSMRVGINTVFGLAGILDVASEAGLERQTEDFGQTLGRWGFGPGPYLVLPFLGPSNVRDASAWPLDRITSFPTLAGDGANVYTLTALELIHTRAGLLNASSILGQVALDRYTFVRDSYLARRRSAVYDGNPPPEPEDDAQEQATQARLRK
jgi:phospholipid-binding lipoprotein MlaA